MQPFRTGFVHSSQSLWDASVLHESMNRSHGLLSSISTLGMGYLYSTRWMRHICCIHSHVEGHLGCFQIWWIWMELLLTSFCVNMFYIYLEIRLRVVSLTYMVTQYMFVIRTCTTTAFHSDCSTLHSDKYYLKIPFVLHFCWPFKFVVILGI